MRQEKQEKREGVVRVYQHHNNRIGVIAEVSADTDFVARNNEFLEFVDNLLMHIAWENPKGTGNLLDQKWMFDDSKSVGDVVKEQRKKFGEHIGVVNFSRWSLDPDTEEEEDGTNVKMAVKPADEETEDEESLQDWEGDGGAL